MKELGIEQSPNIGRFAQSRDEVSTDAGGVRFSPDELAAFERDGYIVVRQLADAPLRARMLDVACRGLAEEIPPIEYEADLQYPGSPPSRQAEGGRTVRRLKQALSRDFCFLEWVSAPPLVGRLRQVLGQEIVVPLAHHNCIMTKQARFSSETGWHQDIRYWSYHRPELLSVWLALTPETRENGCLHLIPGTHRMSLDRRRYDDAFFLRDDDPENQALMAQAVPAELEPGDVLFFHCRTMHAAGRNQADAAKLSVVFTFRPSDNPPRPGTRSASLPEVLLPDSIGP